ncbi:MAG: hypothetical protein ACRDD7_04825 [Peptostreptococcaceae bacterium]
MKCLYNVMKKYEVKDVATVEDFHNKYHKHDRFKGRGKEYANIVIESSYEDLKAYGYTLITKHDSTTGEQVTFYKSA